MPEKSLFKPLVLLLLLTSVAACVFGRPADSTFRHGMVVSASPYASRAGIEILKKGGNAVDAAIAVQFALAVVYPNAGNICGGGFMVYRAASGKAATLDFREEAPGAASAGMYLDKNGNVIPEASTQGYLAGGVPGTVDGMLEAHKKFGHLPWKVLLGPAIQLAKTGYLLTAKGASTLNEAAPDLRKFNGKECALISDRGSWMKGDLLKQVKLAATLESIRDFGRAGFYEGAVALAFEKDMRQGHGLVTAADLSAYHALWREPLEGNYKNYHIISMGPPSSGGVALLQLLYSVEKFPLSAFAHNGVKMAHLYTEAERRVYADRSYYLGDPDFVDIPVQALLSARYTAGRMKNFDSLQATPSSQVKPGEIAGYASLAGHLRKEKKETTHFSVVDGEGNAVSITTTLNGNFGSRVVLPSSGMVLNNEMDDFSIQPGHANSYGLVGGEANAVQAHKRMLSSMTPTIVERDGRLLLVIGTPGGATIITSVFQGILNMTDYGMTVQQAVAAPRIHSQWLPDEILAEENALSPAVRSKLEAMGHTVKTTKEIGRVDAILVSGTGLYQGGADPRGDDATAAY